MHKYIVCACFALTTIGHAIEPTDEKQVEIIEQKSSQENEKLSPDQMAIIYTQAWVETGNRVEARAQVSDDVKAWYDSCRDRLPKSRASFSSLSIEEIKTFINECIYPMEKSLDVSLYIESINKLHPQESFVMGREFSHNQCTLKHLKNEMQKTMESRQEFDKN